MTLRGRLLTSLTQKAPTLVGFHAMVQLLLPRTRYVPGRNLNTHPRFTQNVIYGNVMNRMSYNFFTNNNKK